MDFRKNYNDLHHVKIIKVNSEHFTLVKEGKCKVGDYVICKLGMFYHENNKTDFITTVSFGICDAYELSGDFFDVISDKEVKKYTQSIMQKKDKAIELEYENAKLKAELEDLKKSANTTEKAPEKAPEKK